MFTVEDYLEILLGFRENASFVLEKSDVNLLHSLHKQLCKGVGLTDRQYELLKTKLEFYSDQFAKNEYSNLDFSKTRIPLRQIDRSKWIKKVTRNNIPWLAVRFIFNKNLIQSLERLRHWGIESEYDKQEKTHYYPYTEKTRLFRLTAF
jgi:hypothetical protein